MTRKSRGKKTLPKSEAETAKTTSETSNAAADSTADPSPPASENLAAAASTGETTTGETTTGETTTGKPSKLPAFGFAADLLASRSDSDESADRDSDETQATSLSKETSAELAVPPAAPPSELATEDDPERIFHFADSLERKDEEETVAQRLTTWITFSLEGETFALPVEPVREVLRLSHITRVPHAPRPIRGVTNLRGRVIPVIDLRVRIELPAGGIDRSTRVIVVGSRGRLIGLMVDAVHQVAHIDLNRVQPPPDDVMTVQSDYLAGVYQHEDRLILLLDVDRALILRDAPAENLGQGAA